MPFILPNLQEIPTFLILQITLKGIRQIYNIKPYHIEIWYRSLIFQDVFYFPQKSFVVHLKNILHILVLVLFICSYIRFIIILFLLFYHDLL